MERQLENLDPALARHIRDSASRAGLQAHDPAARMITEMWVAVAALQQEREPLSREIADLAGQMRRTRRYLLALAAIGALNLLGIVALLL
jgi:ferric-dicitrate binding protein FerR (iron transport regulator)